MKKRIRQIMHLIIILGILVVFGGCGNSQNSPVKPSTESAVKENTGSPPSANPINNEDFDISYIVMHMFPGDFYQIIPETMEGRELPASEFKWTTSHPNIVTVDHRGIAEAVGNGMAIIACSNAKTTRYVCVNVYESLGTGQMYDMEMLIAPGTERIYRNYQQGGYFYEDLNDYIAMHGCAACSAATILGVYHPDEAWPPNRWISILEKETDQEAWEKNYSKPINKQMPITMYGISRVLRKKGIDCTYQAIFNKKAVGRDILDHLKTGEPIIFQAGKNGYHVMALLGLMTNGEVLVSDPGGNRRVYTSTLDNIISVIFSCKKEPHHMYFSGRATAGGYVKVGTDKKQQTGSD